MTRQITLLELRRRSGIVFKDGRNTPLGYGRGTVEEGDNENSGPIHKAQQQIGKKIFAEEGYRLFPYQIGVQGILKMADFAAARYKKVILVECLTDFQPDSDWVNFHCKIMSHSFEKQVSHLMNTIIQKKKLMESEKIEVCFIVESQYKDILENKDYYCRKVPSRYMKEFRELNTAFWICRPTKNAG